MLISFILFNISFYMAVVKLIADSGATKAEWCLMNGDKTKTVITQGISPYFLNTEQIKNFLVEPGSVPEFKSGPDRRQLTQKRIQHLGVLLELRRQLKQDRPEAIAELQNDTAKIIERVLAITQLGEVGDFLRGLEGEAKIFRRLRFPILDRLGGGDAVESVIDLGRRKALREIRQHFGRGQILGVEIAFPLRILEARRADRSFHRCVPDDAMARAC